MSSNAANTIIQTKDNGVFSAWNYSSNAVGGKRRRTRGKATKSTRKYRRGKISKGRRTRRV